MAGWRIEPQKTRGKIANRAARVFIADLYSGNIARVHSSARFHFSGIQSYYSLFLQALTFMSHLPTHEECTPVRFWFAVYSRSAGFIRALFARLRVFSVNSAQIMPSQRIFSVKVRVIVYSSHRKYPPTVVFPQIGGCFTFSVQKHVLRINDSPHPQSHLSMT